MTQNIHSELRDNLKGYNDDSKDDGISYPEDLDPRERREFREAINASRRQERGQGMGGGSSRAGGSHQHPPLALSLYKSLRSRKRNIKDSMSSGQVEEEQNKLVSKFFIYENIPPAKADSHHFKNMIIGAQRAGRGIPTPSPY